MHSCIRLKCTGHNYCKRLTALSDNGTTCRFFYANVSSVGSRIKGAMIITALLERAVRNIAVREAWIAPTAAHEHTQPGTCSMHEVIQQYA